MIESEPTEVKEASHNRTEGERSALGLLIPCGWGGASELSRETDVEVSSSTGKRGVLPDQLSGDSSWQACASLCITYQGGDLTGPQLLQNHHHHPLTTPLPPVLTYVTFG